MTKLVSPKFFGINKGTSRTYNYKKIFVSRINDSNINKANNKCINKLTYFQCHLYYFHCLSNQKIHHLYL